MSGGKGSCMCGEIGYSFTGEPALKALCHCTDCQKWSGGAFTSNLAVPRDAFTISKGSPKTYDVTGNSGKTNKHFFCGTCGSSLYTQLELLPELTIIKAGGLDGGAASLSNSVGVEFYTKDRMPYLGSCEGAKQEPVFG